jgi:NADH-quinone oxidoreductase subunit M
MNELHAPWLEMALLLPLVASVLTDRQRTPQSARLFSLAAGAGSLMLLAAGWADLRLMTATSASFDWGWSSLGLSQSPFVLNQFNAPLLVMTALIYFLTVLATLRTLVRRFAFGWTLLSEALLLATLATPEPWLMITLMACSTIPPWLELRARRRPTGVYVWHMGTYVTLLVAGWWLVSHDDPTSASTWTLLPLMVALLIRGGLAPFHCWVTDLFENTTFGTALLVATPMVGAYAMVQLVLPVASDTLLHAMGMLALLSAGYSACMALVQREARRFFCYVFLSHAALVFVGLESVTPIGLTGALCMWISVAVAMTGFGLTLRALEARHGRLTMDRFRGFYDHTPALAVCFLLTGLTSVGFPGTLGFIGAEMLVDGAVQAYPYVGVTVVIVTAINGIAIVKAYFLLLTGARHVSAVPLGMGMRERLAVLTLTTLIVLGGLIPQPGVKARFDAATELLSGRRVHAIAATPGPAVDSKSEPGHAEPLLPGQFETVDSLARPPRAPG